MTAAAPRDQRFAKAAFLLLAAALLAGGLDHLIGTVRWPFAPPPAVRFGYGPRDFPAALAMANDQVTLGRERVVRAPGQWMYQESHARALMGRARLTGSFDDLALASAALNRGMADAPHPGGPVLTDAVANMTLHRLGPVPADLRMLAAYAVPADDGDRAEAAAIAGDVALYSGDYTGAARAYDRSALIEDGPALAVRRANLDKKSGRFDDAIAELDRAIAGTKGPTHQFYANMLLQKGVVELGRGDFGAAADWFARADAAFPGYWLIEAHRAQMAAVKGDLAAAERGYLAILARAAAPGLMPDVMDALAALYRAKGDAANSRLWAARAGVIWARRLAQLPEAAYGHALEHELVLGDPARALDLARRNLAARPYGDSTTMLAWTLLANGQPQAAADAIAALNRTSWRTAQQYAVQSEALAMLGRADASETARQAALALNPRAFDPAAALIWFGNH